MNSTNNLEEMSVKERREYLDTLPKSEYGKFMHQKGFHQGYQRGLLEATQETKYEQTLVDVAVTSTKLKAYKFSAYLGLCLLLVMSLVIIVIKPTGFFLIALIVMGLLGVYSIGSMAYKHSPTYEKKSRL